MNEKNSTRESTKDIRCTWVLNIKDVVLFVNSQYLCIYILVFLQLKRSIHRIDRCALMFLFVLCQTPIILTLQWKRLLFFFCCCLLASFFLRVPQALNKSTTNIVHLFIVLHSFISIWQFSNCTQCFWAMQKINQCTWKKRINPAICK